MGEKTEKATPKKLRDARKKGQVAKSQDFTSVFTFIASTSSVILLVNYLFEQMGSLVILLFKSIPSLNNSDRMGAYIGESIMVILQSSLPIVVITALVGVLVSFLVVGPLFSSEVLKVDLKRLNPVTNIKNMFKLRTWIEMIKSVLKILGAVLLIYSVVYNSLGDIVATAAMPLLGITSVFGDFLVKVIIRVGIFFLAVAVFDLAFQRYNFAKEMRMEKFEVKQEFRDTEGDPHMKGRRRQIAQEIAYQEGPVAARKARAVIVNPIHIAVAIQYHERELPTPKIATMGKGDVAKQIVQIAQSEKIPIMRNVSLAQTLFQKGKIGDYVPEETYEAVAEILQWLKKLEEGETRLDLFQ